MLRRTMIRMGASATLKNPLASPPAISVTRQPRGPPGSSLRVIVSGNDEPGSDVIVMSRSGSSAVTRKRQDGAGRGHQQRIAIGGRACHLARPEQTRGTRPVFGDDRRAPEVLQVDAEDAAEDVGCPSRWKWNDDAYRRAGEVLRLRRRHKGKKHKGQHQKQRSRHDALLLAPVSHSELARMM